MQSKTVITFWVSLSVFLALSLGALLYETNGLLNKIAVSHIKSGNPPKTDLAGTRTPKTDELVKMHKDRFITEVTFFFLGVTAIALIFSIRHILNTGDKEEEEDFRDMGLEEEFDGLEKSRC